MDGRGTTAAALAIRDGEIIASGGDDRIRDLAGHDAEIDLGGRRVLPGLIDASLRGLRMGSTACFSRSPRFDGFTHAARRCGRRRPRAADAGGQLAGATGRGWNAAQLDTPGMLTRTSSTRSHPPIRSTSRPAGVAGGQLNSLGLRRLGLVVGDPGVVRDSAGVATGQVTAAGQRVRCARSRRSGKDLRSTSGSRACGTSSASSTGTASPPGMTQAAATRRR